MTDMLDEDWDDPDRDEDLDCDHEDYDLDWAQGRAICIHCGYSWYLTSEEFVRQCEWAASLAEEFDDEPTLWDRIVIWIWIKARLIREFANRDCMICRRPDRHWFRRVGDHSICDEEIPF